MAATSPSLRPLRALVTFPLLPRVFCRETNLKFKMGLKVTDERLQRERQLAAFDGECGRAEKKAAPSRTTGV